MFVPAGTLHWPAAWVFLGAMLSIGLGCGRWLAKTDPALLAERMRPPIQRDQPGADKNSSPCLGLTFLIWFIAIGLDERLHALQCPSPCRRSGLRC